tara:strand:- start:287 stop:907 length:621 start_codon:yes stop_codon:yes gene_type:complete
LRCQKNLLKALAKLKKTYIMRLEGFYMNPVSSKVSIKMTLERFKENPFLKNMIIPVRGQSVQLSVLGADDNVLVNQSTGEVHGTHVTTYKKVDKEQFVKIFTENIGLTFNLNSAGIKSFNVLLWAVQHKALSKDMIPFDGLLLSEFLNNSELKLSLATFRRGIGELEKSQIIAKTMRKGWYFINPNFCFNGDRIAFTTIIEKNTKE